MTSKCMELNWVDGAELADKAAPGYGALTPVIPGHPSHTGVVDF
jgi:hypothetical protein